MLKWLLSSLAFAFAVVPLAAPANACPHGYKPVWIQGNKVCRLDVLPTDKLKAATKYEPGKSAPRRQFKSAR
jgi:hypothetical protein